MATPEPEPRAPEAFISYSWDDAAHREWVKRLAARLRADGVDMTLDYWHAAPGDQIPAFMERAVRENDFVIAVCTPRFEEKSGERGQTAPGHPQHGAASACWGLGRGQTPRRTEVG